SKREREGETLKRAFLSLRNLHCCLANNGSRGDCRAVRMNRRSAGCVRVSAWGPGPKAPFSACHNKPAQGLVFTGSPAILYYSTLHNKKHLLISADQRRLLKQEKRREGRRERERERERRKREAKRLRSPGQIFLKPEQPQGTFPPVAKVYLIQESL
uniref:Uncharacterized protein n=1 Tax=Oryctolagus cuniculus TaxID=9986 RepID=A0A5F9CT27_RABIT